MYGAWGCYIKFMKFAITKIYADMADIITVKVGNPHYHFATT